MIRVLLFLAALLVAPAHAAFHGSANVSACPYTAFSTVGVTPYDGCSQASTAVIGGLSYQNPSLFSTGAGNLFQSGSASFSASFSGVIMTVSGSVAGNIHAGMVLYCPSGPSCNGFPAGATIAQLGLYGATGTGGDGTYHISAAINIATPTAIIAGQVVSPILHSGPSTALANWNVAGVDFPTGITAGPFGGSWCNPTGGYGYPVIACSSTPGATMLIDPSQYDWTDDPLNTGCKGNLYLTTGTSSTNSVYCNLPAPVTAAGGNPCGDTSICIQGFDWAPHGTCVGFVFKDVGALKSGTVHFRNNRVSYYVDQTCVNMSNNSVSGGYAAPIGINPTATDAWNVDVSNNFVDGNAFNAIAFGTTTFNGSTYVYSWYTLATAPINVQTYGSVAVKYNHFQNLVGRAVTFNMACGGLNFSYNTIHNPQVLPGGGHGQIYEFNAPSSGGHCPGYSAGIGDPTFSGGAYGTMPYQLHFNNTSWNDNNISGAFMAAAWNMDVPQHTSASGGDLIDVQDFEFQLNVTVTNTISYQGNNGVYFAIQPPELGCSSCSGYTVGDIVVVQAYYNGGSTPCEVFPTVQIRVVSGGVPSSASTGLGGVCEGGAPSGAQATSCSAALGAQCANPSASGLSITVGYAYALDGGLIWISGTNGPPAGHVNYEALNIANNIFDQTGSNTWPYPIVNKSTVPLLTCATNADVLLAKNSPAANNLLPYNPIGGSDVAPFEPNLGYHDSNISGNYSQDGTPSNNNVSANPGVGLYSGSGC